MTDDYSDEIPFPPTQGNIRQPGLVEHNARAKAQREADCANPKRAITTEEAERFARWCDTEGFKASATALRSLAAERDALKTEAERLKAGGGARDRGLVMHLDAGNAASYPGSGTTWTDLSGKGTTQFCAEAVALQAENARLREALTRAKDLFLQDEPQKAFIEVCAALGETNNAKI
jgi:hypothetical protein